MQVDGRILSFVRVEQESETRGRYSRQENIPSKTTRELDRAGKARRSLHVTELYFRLRMESVELSENDVHHIAIFILEYGRSRVVGKYRTLYVFYLWQMCSGWKSVYGNVCMCMDGAEWLVDTVHPI